MVIYVIVYIIGFLMAYFAEIKLKNNKKKSGYFFSFCAIMIPTIVAAIRHISVGTDTSSYITNVFLTCANFDSLSDVFIYNVGIEKGYIFVNYIVYKIFNNVHVLYGALEFIILIFIYKACYDNRNKNGEFALNYFLFLVLFYNKSLNMCRQMMAMSIIIYAFKFITQKKFLKYCFWVCIATLFHRSAIAQILLYYAINFIFAKDNFIQFKKMLSIILVMFVVICYEYIMQFIILLISSGGYANRYYIYINNAGNILKYELVFELIVLVLLYLMHNKLIKIGDNNNKYIFIYTLAVILYFCGFFGSFAYRISYYFYLYIIFMADDIKLLFTKNSQFYFVILLMIALIAYSCLCYGVFKYDGTVPYITMWN